MRSFGLRRARSSRHVSPVSGRTANTNWSQEGMTAIARSGIGFLKMPFPRSATESTVAGLIIARSTSRDATAKIPSAVLTPRNVADLPPWAWRSTTLGWTYAGTTLLAALPAISDAISSTRRERVTFGLAPAATRIGFSVISLFWLRLDRQELRGEQLVIRGLGAERLHVDVGLLERLDSERFEPPVVAEHRGLEVIDLARQAWALLQNTLGHA